MENTGIEWTKNTFNPWIGCTKVSPGCANCYAEADDKRRKWTEGGWGKGKPRHRTSEAMWEQPLKWNEEARLGGERKRVFCASLADVFDEEVPKEWRDDLWDLVKACPWLDWQLLTKRPENIPAMVPPDWGAGYPNVWLGTSVENQHYADLRIPLLTAIPAVVHFLSVEPLLGPIRFKSLADIEWVIVGGESGSGSRPMDKTWVRKIQKQVADANVALFFKQWGQFDENKNRVKSKKAAGHALDGKNYREFPKVIVEVAPDVRDLARTEINLLYGQMADHARMTLAKAVTIGGRLMEIKATLKHGQFGKWIDSSLDFDQKTAERYMKIFNGREKLKIDSMSNMASALRLLDEEKRAKKPKKAPTARQYNAVGVNDGPVPQHRHFVEEPMDDPENLVVDSDDTEVTDEAFEIVTDIEPPVLVLSAPEEVLAELLEVLKRHEGKCQHQIIRPDGQVKLNEYFAKRLALKAA